jgi:hypothetical protein
MYVQPQRSEARRGEPAVCIEILTIKAPGACDVQDVGMLGFGTSG